MRYQIRTGQSRCLIVDTEANRVIAECTRLQDAEMIVDSLFAYNYNP